jgi:filamentous hemagglutinin family protein
MTRQTTRTLLSPKTRLVALLASTALVHSTAVLAQSLPTGGQVAAGSATIGSPSAGSLTINQTSGSAVVNWQSFDVGRGNRVTFVQPDANSAILNRVTGQTTSTIAGQINANGQVYLINPNGIAITSTGTVKAGAFVASTLGISDDDFMGGKRTFTGNGASAAVTNDGVITINRGGYMALIGGTVANSGVITVPMGKAALGSGEQATLDLSGDGFLQVAVPTKAGGSKALVENSGRIVARGGTVQLSAAAAKDMARQAVNMSGTIEAKGVSGRSGDITLSGGDGEVAVTGKLDASSRRGTGGKVQVTGRKITLAGAKINASGKTGGGTVTIGGNRQGKGTLQHAETLTVDANTVINADAITTGNGGNVVLWSDDLTRFAGTITARGGAISGNGGEVEVSGKAKLSYTGLTDLTAAHGSFGNLLLDPYNVTISTGTDSNSDGSFNATGNDSVINVNTLTNALQTANVTVTTGSSSDATNPQAGIITVAAPIAWTSGSTLTLNAASDININAAITATTGGLTLASGGNINVPAAVSIGGTFNLTSGNWVQNAAALPTFSAKDFQLNGGSFLRVTGGDGSSATPHAVADIYGLQGIGSSNASLAAKWTLANNIDASGTANWNAGAGLNPIGTYSVAFSGVFDGASHIITGLTVNRAASFLGLFGNSAGTIQNIGLISEFINGYSYTGGLVGNNTGTINNAFTTGTVNGMQYVGGLTGWNSGSINNSSATTAVSGSYDVGGLVGHNHGSISNSYAAGATYGSNTYAGGLAGFNDGTIKFAYATGSVSGNTYVGGLVGYNDSGSSIDNAYATGAVNGSVAVGGLVGRNFYSTITNSFWDVFTTGRSSGYGQSFSGTFRAIGLTTEQMRDSANNATNYAGWDFANTWYQSGNMRPILRSEAATANASGIATINNLHQLALISVNPSGNYVLSADIDASATAGTNASGIWDSVNDIDGGWQPIATFTGSLDGAAHTISGLTSSSGGLFGTIGGGASVNNLSLTAANINAYTTLAAMLASANAGSITSVSVSGTVLGGLGAGGLVGSNSGTIISSSASGSVTGSGDLGGLVANNSGSISGSSTSASVTGDTYGGSEGRGGLVGRNSGTISNSFATGTLSDLSAISWGGLVGINTATGIINQSYASGSANIAYALYSGGLVGLNNGSITQSYATGGIGGYLNEFTGGLAGYNTGTISQSYALGSVSGSKAGGLVGYNTSTGQISYSYAAVSASRGGLAAFNDGTITNSFWNLTVSGRPAASGGGSGTITGTIGLTTDQMANPFLFIDAGWDFGSIWAMSKTGGEPVLRSLTSDPIFNYYVRLSGNTSSIYGDVASASGIALDGYGIGNVSIGWGSAANVGTYAYGDANVLALSYSTGVASDYYIDYGSGSLTINKRVISLSGNRTYDGTTNVSAGNLTLSNLANGETLTLSGMGSMADKNAGSGKAVSLGSLSLGDGSGLASNYTLVGGTDTVDIARAAISSIGGITANGKTYDGSTAATLNTGGAVFNGMLVGDSLTLGTGFSGAFANANAGTGKTVSISGLSLSGSDAGNYTLADTTATALADIGQRVVNLSGSRTYNGSSDLDASIFSLGNLATGETLTLSGTGAMADKNAGSGKAASLGSLLLGDGSGLASNYTLVGGTDTVDIAKAIISSIGGITASNKIYDGNADATLDASGVVFNGRIIGDTLTLDSGFSGLFSNANAGTGKTVDITGLSLSGTDAGNYTLASSTATTLADIGQRIVNLSGSRVYNGSSDLAASIFTLSNLVDGETLALSGTGSMGDKNAGFGKTVSLGSLSLGDGSGLASNYTLVGGADTVNIDRASLSVSGITALNKTYDGTTIATLDISGAVFNGRIGNDVLTFIATANFGDANVGTGKSLGFSNIRLGGADTNNYWLISTNAVQADITPRAINLSGSRTYNGSTSLDASIFTLSNLVSGETLALSGTGSMADKNAGSGKAVALGSLLLGDGSGLASNYTLSGGSDTVDIAKAIISSIGGITANGKTYDGNANASLNTAGATFNGMVVGDALTVATSTGAFSNANAGTGKTVSISGLTLSGADAGNYTLADTTASSLADIGKRILSLSGSRTYNGSSDLDASIFSLGNLVTGETLTLSGTGAMADKNAGSGKVVTLGSLLLGNGSGLASNYTLSGGTDTVDIAKAIISSIGGITANGKTYDGTTSVTLNSSGATFNGMVAGDNLTLGTGFSGAFSDKNAGAGKTVSISGLSLSGTDAGNYTLASGTATTLADIAKAYVFFSGISVSSKVYDGTTAATVTISTVPVISTDDMHVAYTSASFSDKNAGMSKAVAVDGLYLIGADAGNYQLGITSHTSFASITPAIITSIGGITANGKTYDGSTTAALNTSGAVFNGVIGNDVLTVGSAIGAFSDQNVGTGKTVTISGLTLGGADALNYRLDATTAAAFADVGQRILSLSGSRTYNGSTDLDASIFSLGNLVSGETLTLSGTGSMADKNAGLGKAVSLGSLSFGDSIQGDSGLASNYTLAGGVDTVDIAKAIISQIGGITASGKTYDGTMGASLDTSHAVFNGLIGSDVLSVGNAIGSFSDKNAGTGKTVSISGLTLSGADAGNYTLASDSATTTADIARAVISSITGIGAGNKTYDGSTTAVLDSNPAIFNGMISGDSLSVAGGTGVFANANAGTGKTVSISGLTLSGTDAGNYTLADATATALADIGQRVINLSGSRTYNGSSDLAASIFTLSNLVSGETLALSGTGSMADKNAGSGKVVSLGSLSLGNGSGLASNYTLSGGTDTVDIARAVISSIGGITANGKTYDGSTGVTLNTSGAVFNGMIVGDSLALGTGFASAFLDANAGTGKAVDISGLSLSGTDSGNYTLADTTATTLADIGQRILSLSGSRTYNGSTSLDASIFTLSNLVSGETLTLSGTGSMADKNAGSGKAVTLGSLSLADGSGLASNYTLSGGSDTVDIAKAIISSIGGITANGKTYDGNANASLNTAGATFNGMVVGDALTVATSTGAFSNANAGTGKTVSITGLSLSGTDAGNYTLADTTASSLADIGQRAITVSANNASRAYGDVNPTLTYTLGGAGLVAGDTLSGALATSAAGTSGVGAYGITQGSLAASGNYDLTFTGGSLMVTPRAITASANNQSRAYGDANPVLAYTIGGAGLVNGDTLSGILATSATGSSGVGSYGITQGSLAASGNYDLTFTGGMLAVTPRAITVSANSASRIYGDQNPAFSYSVGGLVNGDALTGALSTDADPFSNIGSYVIGLGSLGNANYAISYSGGNLTIVPRSIIVTANNASRVTGAANPFFTYTIGGAGLVNGDRLLGQLTTVADRRSGAGSYAITQGSLAASANYDTSFIDGVLTVTATVSTPSTDLASTIIPRSFAPANTTPLPPAQGQGDGTPTSASDPTGSGSHTFLADPRFDGTVVCLGNGAACIVQPSL